MITWAAPISSLKNIKSKLLSAVRQTTEFNDLTESTLEDVMSVEKLKVVHYLNQFFGQIGSEEKADIGFLVKPGPVGPGLALQKALGDRADVLATIICGDNYFSKNPDMAGQEALQLIEPYRPDLFFAGPAFAAGRYGIACGAICRAGRNWGFP
jgi:hypothetical protein